MLNVRLGDEADRLIEEALALPAAARGEFVRAAAPPDLVPIVEAIVAEASSEDGFLPPGGALSADFAREILGDEEGVHAGLRLEGRRRLVEYEILGVLGHGGMGEVYLARDARLGRDVALKLLPDRFAGDQARVRRFREEARFLASLNHPNVGAIFGFAEQDGLEALVLELVEGETLADRIARGPLPLDEALAVARQVAAAVEAAHARGIIHRDLKPSNVKISPDGRVKVLDFGIARWAAPSEEGAFDTMSAPQGILGTAPYMSPEQARGRKVDRRTDLWAFGCVLYEMLAGCRAFQGDSAAETIAAVLTREPDLARLPPAVPPTLVRLIEKCLAKDSAHRPADIREVIAELEQKGSPATHRAPGARRSAVGLAITAGVLLLAALGYFLLQQPARPVNRLAVPIPAEDELVISTYPLVAISPDGSRVVYRARRHGVIQLFQRTMDRTEPLVVPGTKNAAAPFFSPDGRWLGFDGDGRLMKASAAGGEPVLICDAPGGAMGSWGDDGTIVFATATGRVLQRLRPGSTSPEPLTALDGGRGEASHGFPHVLPGSRAVLFTVSRATGSEVAVAGLEGGPVRVLTAGMQPRYLRTGHLLFARGSTLWAAPFDAGSLRVQAEPAPVLEGVDASENGVAHFAVSDEGTLVYVPPRAPVGLRHLTWLDSRGQAARIPGGSRRFVRAAVSPDGTRVAAAIREADNTDIWIVDASLGTATRLTSGPEEDTAPLWTPDGKQVVFRSARSGGGLFVQDAFGTTEPRQLTKSGGEFHTPYAWAAGGRSLLFSVFRGYRLQSIAALEAAGGGEPRSLLSGEFAQLRPSVSPDGRWLAYQSDESGRFEVYVRRYPSLTDERWQISTRGGTSPEWSADGRQLFFYDGKWIQAIAVTGGRPDPSTLSPVVSVKPFMSRLGPDYDVAPGPRFLFIMDEPPADPVASRPQLALVQNWFTELHARLASR